jgi:hypothetical protein
MKANVLRLGVVAVYTTNVDTKHTLQIYEKQSYEARHPPLRQTAVSCWRSFVRVLKRFTVNVFKLVIYFLSGFECRVFFIFRREGKFFNSIFSLDGNKHTLFAALVCVWIERLQNVCAYVSWLFSEL